MARSVELTEKAVALQKLYIEVSQLAAQNDYGFDFDIADGTSRFDDWLSSSCYGEEENETFGVNPGGVVWESSSC